MPRTIKNSRECPNELWNIQLTINTTIQKPAGLSPVRLLIDWYKKSIKINS